jgi:hypothetical protein
MKRLDAIQKTLQLIELMIEHCSRFETYLAEVQAVQELGISFQEWRHLTPTDETMPSRYHPLISFAYPLILTFSPSGGEGTDRFTYPSRFL